MGFLRKYAGFVVFVSVLGTIPLIVKSPFHMHILLMTLLFVGLSSAWNILGGYGGQISLGHAAFFGIGAYVSSLLYINYHISPWIGMILGGLTAGLVGGVISYPSFRLRGPFFTLVTIAFAEVARILAIHFRDVTGGSVGLLIPFDPEHSIISLTFTDKRLYFYLSLTYAAVVILTVYLITRSRLGYFLVSIREDEEAAKASGVNAPYCKVLATMISGFFTGVGGVFYAQYILFIEPYAVFSLDFSILIALICLIGGMGTVWGPIFGAFLIVPLNEFLRGWLGGGLRGLYPVTYGSILILVVLFAPEGILEKIKSLFFTK